MTKQELLEYAAQVLGVDHIEEWVDDIQNGVITTKDQVDAWIPR